jgi:spore maturation protein CgeB
MRAYLCTAPSANNRVIPQSKVWIKNLSRGLMDLGIELRLPEFDIARHMRECRENAQDGDLAAAKRRFGELLVHDIRQAHKDLGLDLVVAYVWDIHVFPEAIQQIRALSVPTVLFFCNAAHQFHLVQEVAPHFDYCMVPERQALSKYRAVGANPLHIQMAADPRMYRPYRGPRIYDVTFVGGLYLNRPLYVSYLAWHGIDVRVWGPRWREAARQQEAQPLHRRIRRVLGDVRREIQRRRGIEPAWYPLPAQACGGILEDEEMVRLPGQSRICLNFSEVEDKRTGEIKRHIRLRDFEVPMGRGLLMTGQQDELAEYYEIGREIVCYDSKEELLEKCRYYLGHPREAEAIVEAGHRRARSEHTWAHRFDQLLSHMGLKPPLAPPVMV